MAAAVPGFVEELAKSFRRIRGSQADGDLMTIWHQGKGGAELLSWEDGEGALRQQELSFYGQMVLWKLGQPVETATVPTSTETTHSGMSKSDVLKPDPEPSPRTLQHAAALLSLVEPIMLIVMGVIIATLLISVYLPLSTALSGVK